MKANSFVIVGAILALTETRLGRSQTSEARDGALRQECPSGTPYSVSEGKVCNKTSLCPGEPATRHCQCDDQCLFYGDCCINAPTRVSNGDPTGVPLSNDFQYEECQPTDRDNNGFYMISRCPETSRDDNTRKLCENDPNPDPKNTLLLTPVTDVTNGRLFRNVYCAMCHKTALDDVYFWLLQVRCYHKTNDNKNNDDISSSTVQPTAIPDDEGTGIDDGTSVSEEDNPIVDDGTSVSENDNGAIDDGTSVSEDDSPVIDDGTSVSENDNGAIDDGTSVSEDDNPVTDDGTSVSENDNGAIDDGTSVSEDDNLVIDDGTSVSENDNGEIDDGTSISEDYNGAIDDGTSASEDDNDVTDDGTSISATTVSGDYGPTQSSDLLYVLSLLSDPACKVKFSYRYHQRREYRSCKVFNVGHYVNDGGQKVPCPSYLDPYFTNGVIYKNRDCASCNNDDMSSPVCNSSSIFTGEQVRSFSNLFLHSGGYRTSSAGPINPSTCAGNAVYDPYSHLCRPFITFDEPKGLNSENPQNFSDVTGEFYLQNAGCISNQSKVNACEGINHILTLSFESLMTSFLPNFDGRLKNISTSCYPHKDVSVCKKESSDTSICTFRGLLKSESISDVTEMEPHTIGELLDENYRHNGCASELTIDIQKIFITTSVGSSRCDGLASRNQSSGLAFTWKEEHNMTFVKSEEQKCPGEIKCPWSLTRFEKSEYVFDGSDVILKTLKQHLSKDLYRKMEDGFIAACVNLENNQSDVRKLERQEKVQIILTAVGGSLSVVCLTATVLTYLIFPRLRNNVGKAILSLVLSLLIAQLFQLALWDKTKNEDFCAFVAILSHYSFLAAFFWMNILGFDLSRTFGSRAKMQAVRDSRKIFFFYSLYGWFSPLLIVGACMAIHFGKFEKLNSANEWAYILQYGNNHTCWIVDQVALTYAFGVPVAVLLLCNAVFLADTIFGIFSARAATRRATHTNPQLLGRDGKKDFLLFCKLSCIMGISWVFGFVAAFTDMQAFHVIFILLNSTQGIFIFLAFGCNDRVIEMWRSKYTKQKLTSMKSNSYTATAKTSVNSISGQQVNQIRVKRDQERFSPV